MDYESRSRDRQDETQLLASNNQLGPNSTFFQDKTIPFEFHIKMPSPRYYPMILKRDEKGRIITSKFPGINI